MPTNSLSTSGQFAYVLHNTIEDELYDILTTTNLTLPLTNWTVEQSVLGSSGDFTLSQLALNGRPNLFICARFGGSSDGSGLPDWWESQYFATNEIDPFAQDPSGDGWTYLEDFERGFVPGTWHKPPPPSGLTVKYNSSTGAANVSWSYSPGAVQSYSVQKYVFQTFSYTTNNYSASINGFSDTVPTTPDMPEFYGPLIEVGYSVQAHYAGGDSDWSQQVPIQPTFDPASIYSSSLSAQMILGQQNQAYLAVKALPAGVVALRVTRMDYNDPSFNTNIDITLSSVTNGITSLPLWIAGSPVDGDGYASYRWWLQTLDASNNPSAPLSIWNTESFSELSGFYDGRQQMKQNMDFLLRIPTLAPFYYFGFSSDGLSQGDFESPTNYVYAGLYSKADASFDAFFPFEENYLFHNFVINQPDLDTSGKLTTGAHEGGGGETDLQYPVTYEFQQPISLTTIPAILDASSEGRFTYNTSLGLDQINVTSASGNYYMTNDTVNYFGLPFESALFATNNTGFAILNAGGNIPAVGGSAYPSVAVPTFTNLDYYFIEPILPNSDDPPANLIPGNTGFSVTNRTPLLFASFGDPIRFVCYEKKEVSNGYPGNYAYLGQYFESAYIIDTNGITTTNSAGIVSPYGTFLPTIPGPAALVTMTNWGENVRGTGVVNVLKLQLDVNHDGEMDLSFGGPDNTSSARPFVFWVNNDDDGEGIGNEIYIGTNSALSDSYQEKIRSQRNLEDFARLWICGMPPLPPSEGYHVTLSLENSDNTQSPPLINLYHSYEYNGGTGYLTDTNIAAAQLAPLIYQGLTIIDYNAALATIGGSESYELPLDGNGKLTVTNFLFEGAWPGKGRLILTVLKGSNTVAQTATWLDLHDINDLYERAVVTNVWRKWPEMVLNNPTSGFKVLSSLKLDIVQTNELAVFVHGWRMPVSTWREFSETMFKRMYWQGYQGGFASLYWPTRSSDSDPSPLDFVTYNRSEHIAFESANGAAAYLNDLRTRFPDYQISVAAHSMGNIVMMETMKQLAAANQRPINNYVLMQAAVPSQCYDILATNSSILQLAEAAAGPTPNSYNNYAAGITNALREGGEMINFFNPLDFALTDWVFNQSFIFPSTSGVITMKPNTYLGYYTDGINSLLKTNDLNTSVEAGLGIFIGDGSAAWYYYGPTRVVTAPHELMPFVSRPRSDAVGMMPGVNGVIRAELNLQTQLGFTSETYDHSGEFNRNIQDPVVKPFYFQLQRNLFP